MRWTDPISIKNHPRVSFKKFYNYAKDNTLTVRFTDMTKYNFTVENKLAKDVCIFETSGLLGEDYGDALLLSANQKDVPAIFFTERPNLVACFQKNEKSTYIGSLQNFNGKSYTIKNNFFVSSASSGVSVTNVNWEDGATSATSSDAPFLWHYAELNFGEDGSFTTPCKIIARYAGTAIKGSDCTVLHGLSASETATPTSWSVSTISASNFYLFEKINYRNCVPAGKCITKDKSITVKDFD